MASLLLYYMYIIKMSFFRPLNYTKYLFCIIICFILTILFCLIILASGFASGERAIAGTKTAYVDNSTLKLRKGPSTSYDIVVDLKQNDLLAVKAEENGWYKVIAIHNDKKYDGYVKASYVTMGAPSGLKGYVNYSYLNLRSKKSTSSDIVVKLSEHDIVKISAYDGEWFKVTAKHAGESYKGYVACQYIKIGKVPSSVEKGYVNYEFLNVRKKATTDSDIVVVLKQYDVVTIKKTLDGWYQVTAQHDGKSYDGYVSAKYITKGKVPASVSYEKGYVNSSSLNLRKKATTDSDIIVVHQKYDVVTIKKTTGSWYQVTAEHNGKKYDGYVKDSYITKGSVPKQDSSSGTNGKIIYLTFDDGPGAYTEELLGVLKKYGVKATFFVTNQFPKYQNMIAKEAAAGHTVAVHTYSHEYSKIYSSESAFYADINKMNALIREQTGSSSKILRFPGGSSNAVSKSYCSGIMTKLVKSVGEHGFVYSDWNVDSGDAGGTTSTAQVVANVKNGCKNKNVSVVLQHDIKSYSVKAVEEIIKWGLSEGYSFKAMTTSNGIVHFSKLNN